AAARARERGSPLGVAYAMFWRAHASFRAGAVADAESDARETLNALDAGGWSYGSPVVAAFLVDALIERGELDGAQEALDAAGLPARVPPPAPATRLPDARGRLRLARGEAAAGLADVIEAGRRLEEAGMTSPAWIPWRSTAAVALAAAGDASEASRLAGEEV